MKKLSAALIAFSLFTVAPTQADETFPKIKNRNIDSVEKCLVFKNDSSCTFPVLNKIADSFNCDLMSLFRERVENPGFKDFTTECGFLNDVLTTIDHRHYRNS